MRYRILITDDDLGDGALEREILETELDAKVWVEACRTEDDVLETVRRTQPHGMLVQWAPITRKVFEAADHLRSIGRFGIGIDMIDMAAASEHGVVVDNVPDYCIEEVATHAISLSLALWRRISQFDAELRSGRWAAADSAGHIRRLSASTVGLVGLGRIGSRAADMFAGLGARVLVADPVQGDDHYPRVDLPTLAAEAHLISLHAPLVPSTAHLVDDDFLTQCAQRPIIVNTSRGGLIDAVALTHALHDGRVSGAGLDVFEQEPLAADHPLRCAPNALLTPHAAWASDAALPELRRSTALAVVRRLQGVAV